MVQTITIEKDGRYQIEAYGTQGGKENGSEGGKGGYVKGEVKLHEGDTLYIAAGNQGGSSSKTSVGVGGYNGGGTGGNHKNSGYYYGAGGGGALGHSSKITNINGGSPATTNIFGQGTKGLTSIGFQEGCGGGGGGYYGGDANVNSNSCVSSGYGGSSWTNAELADSTIGIAPKVDNVIKTAGQQSDRGKCIIKYLSE